MLSPTIIRILIADDHPVLRQGLVAMISSQPDLSIVGEASSGAEAITLYQQIHPGILLVDLEFPDMTGIDVITAVCAIDAGAKVIVLTTYVRDMQAIRALKAGARGYLMKATLRSQLLDCVRAVYAGKLQICDDVAAELALHAGEDALTEREMQVLKLVSMGTSNRVIGERLQIAEYTVKDHLKSILSKLGAVDRTHAVTIAVKRGYFDL